MSKLPKLLVILGPTASGKTALSIELAKKFDGEIINADSRQIYQGMDIGTAKIPEKEREGIPHHLFDIVDPDERYTLFDYKKDCEEVIAEIISRGKLPILVGGTGLYISAIIENYQLSQEGFDLKRREELSSMSLSELQNELKKLDPDTVVDLYNKVRIIREIERLETGQTSNKGPQKYDYLLIEPEYTREELYERINQRQYEQIDAGLEQEAQEMAKKYGWDIPSMSGIGYRQFKDYFAGNSSKDEVIAQLQKDNRNYAKRQITWFKRYADQIQFVATVEDAEQVISEWIHT